ncbi:sensor histidine kinase [Paraburkholderia kururiensis]|uniref:histidine kinase n=1 Tax=Paraburkholderia kururiensis TaxID=984307 RepID=A0ABZ0WP74_9BURK|nr:HAMP domain-containing sensor histidine kinase [Paraburkholderia kururiensis]WQD79056.1 HAMP domain-containing sensor histidine kinase [Paraburkholderia kururiensis]
MSAAQRRFSFASQLAVFWVLVAVMCALLIGLVWFMAQGNLERQIGVARQQTLAGCEAVASRYDLSIDRTADAQSASNRDLMHAILDVVLAQMPGVEGGFWRAADSERGIFDAYAFPTYEGSGIKRDIPQAETPLILRTLRAATSGHAASEYVEGQQDAVIVSACPVPHRAGLFAWTLTRVRPPLGPHGKTLVTALALLLAVIVGSAIALGTLLRRWRSDLARVEQSLSEATDLHAPFTPIALTGEPDLDKIVAALNAYGARTTALQRQASDLDRKLAGAERFAALGRLAAQIAHEIRNPIGAMRLKAENALAGDAQRKHHALVSILEQIQRVEMQLSGLLALTQPVRIDAQPVALREWLAARIELHRDAASRAGIALALAQSNDLPDEACFDAAQLARAIDNLILNALRHTPAGGHVTLRAAQHADILSIEVADDGPGVPLAEREHIFEPFVTGHASGSGLGLAVVREIAVAHGGRAFYAARPHGACFVIELPCHTS